MKQVAQTPRDGRISVVDVPPPTNRDGRLLIATRYSLISAGTERTKIDIGEKNLIQKARARPDQVKKAVDRARVEGVRSAIGVARDRLHALTPIGYSAAGVVLEISDDVEGVAPGDAVACGGEGANHAEVLSVPKNLVARIPQGVSFEEAAYATVGAIAMHGVRQAEASIGECLGVIGLGLVGQLATRIILASGCKVLGIDLDPSAVELARGAGAIGLRRDDTALEQKVRAATGGLGLDAVLLCASSASPDPLEVAVGLTRDRGRIVVVGETRIDVDRAPMYEKELELRMSRAYGPGRYDRDYEERGHDLPHGYVRWTEQRNMQSFLDLVAAGSVRPSELTTHTFPIEEAARAYELLRAPRDGTRSFGILIEYGEQRPAAAPPADLKPVSREAGIGLIGPGAFARGVLIPALQHANAPLVAVASEGGLTAADVAERFGFDRTAASAEELLADPSITAVVIVTRHSTHASLTAAALEAGKAVFVEKPLALTPAELLQIEDVLRPDSLLMVGFNRRFAPLVGRLQQELEGCDELLLAMRVNAGPLPESHWLHDPNEGGGRLLGEGCHFVDLLATLAGSNAISAHAFAVPRPGRPVSCSDSFSAQIRFRNAVATLAYSGGGDPRMPKERLEVFGGGIAATLDDFRSLQIWRSGKRREWKSSQDKGHRAEISTFVNAVRGEQAAPSASSYLESTRITLALADSLQTGLPVDLAGSRS